MAKFPAATEAASDGADWRARFHSALQVLHGSAVPEALVTMWLGDQHEDECDPLIDFLEANKQLAWASGEALIDVAYRLANAEGAAPADVRVPPDQQRQALLIADEAMLEHIQSDGVPIDERTYGLADEVGCEVQFLEDASPALREAVDWLSRRGRVEVAQQDASGEVIRVLHGLAA